MAELVDLESSLGYRFRDRSLLLRALTHRSYANEAGEETLVDNEPLEFLGDSILAFVVSAEIHRRYPTYSEGRLSKIRAALVQSSNLSRCAQRLGLGAHLRLGKGETKTGGSGKDSLLADAFEAVVAAIYLDGGIRAARKFLLAELSAQMREAGGDGVIFDFKSALQERVQSGGGPPPHYEMIEEIGPDHHKTFVVELRIGGQTLARGTGRSKKEAQQAAARIAIENGASPAPDASVGGGEPSA